MLVCLSFGCEVQTEEPNPNPSHQQGFSVEGKTLAELQEHSNKLLQTATVYDVMGWDENDKTDKILGQCNTFLIQSE